MARGVQNVHALACVVELQHRGSDGDTALLLDVHPVGHGVLCALLALDRASLIDGSTVQQQLFGQRRFAGVGVADDSKRPAALDFFTICHKSFVLLRCGPAKDRDEVIKQLIDIQYTRNEMDFHRGTFRVRGDVLEIFPANSTDRAVRVEFFGDEIERITDIDVLTGEIKSVESHAAIFPASHYVVPQDYELLLFRR